MVDIPPLPKFPAFLGGEYLRELFDKLYPKTHAGTVLLLASRVEKSLELLLAFQMEPISKTQRAKIFDSVKAPLGTFSAKIEVARGLHLISAREYQGLHAIREIRNRFAHADVELHIDSDDAELHAACAAIPGSSKRSRMTAFLDAVVEFSNSMQATSDQHLLAAAVRATGEKRQASLEKSDAKKSQPKRRAQDSI